MSVTRNCGSDFGLLSKSHGDLPLWSVSFQRRLISDFISGIGDTLLNTLSVIVRPPVVLLTLLSVGDHYLAYLTARVVYPRRISQ